MLGGTTVGRGKTAGALLRAVGRPSRICSYWRTGPTISTLNRFSGWRSFFLDFRAAVIFRHPDRYFLDGIAHAVIELDGGRCYSLPGTTRPTWNPRRLVSRSPNKPSGGVSDFLRIELEVGYARAGGATLQIASPTGKYSTKVAGIGSAAGRTRDGSVVPAAPELGNTCSRTLKTPARKSVKAKGNVALSWFEFPP